MLPQNHNFYSIHNEEIVSILWTNYMYVVILKGNNNRL